MSSEREQFEKWATEKMCFNGLPQPFLHKADGGYLFGFVEVAFDAWQAAYEAGRSSSEITSLKAELLSALEGLEMECGPDDARSARMAELRKG